MMSNPPRINTADLPQKAEVSRAFLAKLQAALKAGDDDAAFSALVDAFSNAIIQLDRMLMGLREHVDRLEARTRPRARGCLRCGRPFPGHRPPPADWEVVSMAGEPEAWSCPDCLTQDD